MNMRASSFKAMQHRSNRSIIKFLFGRFGKNTVSGYLIKKKILPL